MSNLLYKELRLSVHWFFFLLPILLACLMFIPGWIYSFVFMYFFWISISQICAGYTARQDNSFNAMLPVTKKSIVQAKISAILIIQGIHIVTALIFGMIHNRLYGQANWFFDINVAFFGMMILLYAIFNILFFPQYFKTAYFFGKPVILGVVVTLIYSFILEFGVFKYEFMRNIFEGDISTQWIIVAIALVLSALLMFITVKKSIHNYESIR
jgi:hypothetical protein